ncbi:MAG: tRNA dihydrouridine synthase DusB [Rhodobacterales bacterium]|nr:tRNA dihydrouridine synthase DusB [Rhodobacterales bacterium]
MRIRDIDIANGLALAPMEGVTDVTFRRLIRQIGGCGLFFTEFIPAAGLIHDASRCLRMAQFDEDERPIAIQVYGREPSVMADAARYVQDLGADIVDLNMGCPSKRVCKNSGGSALMKEPDLALKIVEAMRAAVDVPFTVKMRSGWDQENKNAPSLARRCAEAGAEAVTVHWRTRADGYKGQRELDTIAAVVDAVDVPVFANGDIIDGQSGLDTWNRTGAEGLMIGRGAIRDPWVFQRIVRAQSGEKPLQVTASDKERVLLGYYAALRATFHNDHGALGRMKKIAGYFTDGLPHGIILRQAIYHSNTVEEAYDRVGSYFEDLRLLESGKPNPFLAREAG